MKKVTSAILATALGVTMLSGPAMATDPVKESNGLTAVQTQKFEEEAEQSVKNYIKAIEKKDVEEMTKWVKDTRFQSIGEQKQEYQKMFDVDPFSDFKIVDTKTKDDKNVNVTIQLMRKDTKQIEKVELPIIKDNDSKWKLVLGDAETKAQNVTYTVRSGNEQAKNPISTEALTSIAYYEFFLHKAPGDFIYPAKTYSASSFDVIGNYVTIKGHQQESFHSPVYVLYQVVVKGLFTDDVKGGLLLNGYFPKTGTWYNYDFWVTPVKGAHLKITNTSSETGSHGAGNVYEYR
ncbi:DUF4878 domain-containing protein [Paenibacillus elgii]|uniref:DUF4878 domain-containing protein n=1 Tax=Paenibacillus elgii TaxID=189691 RepID=UPI000248C26B|nr:DUF4878 domain-containing protein [Paenibacillus elgii]